MSSACNPILRMAFMAMLAFSVPAHAVVYNLNGTYQVDLVRGDDLVGLINTGDDVFVEAFYDTDLAQPVPTTSDIFAGYIFPAGAVGLRYTVNDLVWETTGPMAVEIHREALTQFHTDGSVAATYGYVGWLAYTNSGQNPYLDTNTTMLSPFGIESGVGQWMLYLPTFETHLFNGTELPTDLDVTQLAGPFFVHGAAAGLGPNGDYFFNFTSPIPEPETYAMLLAGLGILGVTARRKKRFTPRLS